MNELGLVRVTEDIDLLIDGSVENQRLVRQALRILPERAIDELGPQEDLREWMVVRVNDEITVDLMTDPPLAQTKEENWEELIRSYLRRLTAGLKSKENEGRIFDARLEDGILQVVSADFERLEVTISKIGPLAKAGKETAERFEIDEDGSYIYWPDLDLHLGWEQLQQVVDPLAVQRAKQKNRQFNVRYGAAIRKFREEKGLAVTAIPGLSHKQLRRIERGESRLTSNAASKLAEAHGITPNEYLQAVSTALQ